MRFLRTTLVIVVIGLAGLLLTKDVIAKAAVSGGITAITGLHSRIEAMQVEFLKTTVGLRGLQIMNPPGFSDHILVDIPDLYVDYRFGFFLQGKVHLDAMRLHLKELHVVRNRDGRLNLHAIKVLESGKTERRPTTTPRGKMPAFQIDRLELKIGKVIFRDDRQSPPIVKEFNVNIDERYDHIPNPAVLTGLIISRALLRTTVGQLANFDVAGLQSTVIAGLRESAGELTGTLTEGAQKAGQVGQEAVGTAKEAVQGAAGTLKKLFGN